MLLVGLGYLIGVTVGFAVGFYLGVAYGAPLWLDWAASQRRKREAR